MNELFPIVERLSQIHFVDKFLVAAIIQRESNWDRYAIRYEPNFPYLTNIEEWAKKTGVTQATETVGQKISWSLCQMMGATARWLGFAGDFPQLTEPEISITYGCIYVARLINKHGNMFDSISAYNAGRPLRIGTTAKYVNQEYVDGVIKNYVLFKTLK